MLSIPKTLVRKLDQHSSNTEQLKMNRKVTIDRNPLLSKCRRHDVITVGLRKYAHMLIIWRNCIFYDVLIYGRPINHKFNQICWLEFMCYWKTISISNWTYSRCQKTCFLKQPSDGRKHQWTLYLITTVFK